MRGPYHAGELRVQALAGVQSMAARVGGGIRPAIPPAAQAFLRERRMVAVAAVDAAGRPWASLLAGEPGFVEALDEHTVRIRAHPAPGDPAGETLHPGALVGMIALDAETRRRARINGRVERMEDGAFLIRTHQVYSNCPKYIQRRAPDAADEPRTPGPAARTPGLSEAQRDWIRRADTFFVATANPGEGADASHRGGLPGFVQVRGDRLVWPDYAGNTMFNTLGNIAAHPWAGLVFPDYETGATLQVTGRAEIDWDPAGVPGAERRVGMEVEDVVEIRDALPQRLRLVEYSPFNPPVHDAPDGG